MQVQSCQTVPLNTILNMAEIKNEMVISGINHNVDELLVGIYTQISLRRHQQAQASQHGRGSKVNRILLSGSSFASLPCWLACAGTSKHRPASMAGAAR
jgi:hypothetical protein